MPVLKAYDWTERHAMKLAIGLAGVITLGIWSLILFDGTTIRSADEADFLKIAINIVNNGTYAVEPDSPTAYRSPGIVFLITPIVALGGGLVEARLLNALVMGLGLIVLFLLVRRHATPLAGLLAVIMIPLWPVTIYTGATLYPQTLGAVLLITTLWRVDLLADEVSPGKAVAAGLPAGGLVLTLPVTLLLFPLWPIWIGIRARRWMTAITIFCVTSGSVVSIWTVRNYLTFNAFIPVATSSGYNLLAGNAPDARHDTSTNVRFPEYVYTEITGKSEVERQEIMTRAAAELILADPGRFLRLYVGKFIHWFDYSNTLTSDSVLEDGASSVNVSTRDLILLVTYIAVIIGPLALHVILCRRVPFRRIDYLFFAFWIGAGAVYALYFTRVRFRVPFDWLVIASNAMFLATLAEMYVNRLKARLSERRRHPRS